MSPADTVTGGTATDTPITYDINTAFAPIHIFGEPATQTLTTTSTDTNALEINAAHNRVFSFKVSGGMWPYLTAKVTWTGNFAVTECKWNGDTANAAGVTCDFATARELTIRSTGSIAKDATISVTAKSTNPGTTGNVDFNLMVYHRYNLNVTDISTSATSISIACTANCPTAAATTWTTTVSKILLSWGVDRTATAFTTGNQLGKVFKIYTSAAAN